VSTALSPDRHAVTSHAWLATTGPTPPTIASRRAAIVETTAAHNDRERRGEACLSRRRDHPHDRFACRAGSASVASTCAPYGIEINATGEACHRPYEYRSLPHHPGRHVHSTALRPDRSAIINHAWDRSTCHDTHRRRRGGSGTARFLRACTIRCPVSATAIPSRRAAIVETTAAHNDRERRGEACLSPSQDHPHDWFACRAGSASVASTCAPHGIEINATGEACHRPYKYRSLPHHPGRHVRSTAVRPDGHVITIDA